MVWPGVATARRVKPGAAPDLAVGEHSVGAVVEIVGGVELVDFAQNHVASGKIGRAADDLRARRRAAGAARRANGRGGCG